MKTLLSLLLCVLLGTGCTPEQIEAAKPNNIAVSVGSGWDRDSPHYPGMRTYGANLTFTWWLKGIPPAKPERDTQPPLKNDT